MIELDFYFPYDIFDTNEDEGYPTEYYPITDDLLEFND